MSAVHSLCTFYGMLSPMLLALGTVASLSDGVVSSLDSSGALSVTLKTGEVIIDRWVPEVVAGLKTSVSIAVGGFDIEITRDNTADPQPYRVPPWSLPRLSLGANVAAYDFSGSGWPELMGTQSRRLQATYPNELYAPVAVLRTASVAVGVAVMYPILEYRHDVSIAIEPTRFGDWRIDAAPCQTGRTGDLWWGHDAQVVGPQTWTWRISWRFTTESNNWNSTLSPYVEWFRKKYGSVTYTRDSRPIRGLALASMADQTTSNPGGWTRDFAAPDVDGYQGAAYQTARLFQQWKRLIWWAPSGLAVKNPQLNYPYQFASRWTSQCAEVPEALRRGPAMIRAIPVPSGGAFGLWWGHAAEQTPCFDSVPSVRVDPTNSDMMAQHLAELKCGSIQPVTLIGLDAFAHSHNPIWNLVPILTQMQQAAPDVKFCTEGQGCDVLHRLAPTWVDAYRTAPFRDGENERIRGPHVLADLILPGHEMWAGMCFDRSADPNLFGPSVRASEIRRTVLSVMSFGYVPVLFTDVDLSPQSPQ